MQLQFGKWFFELNDDDDEDDEDDDDGVVLK